MFKNLLANFGIAAVIRWLLMMSNFSNTIKNRVEISTPLNSWKRSNYTIELNALRLMCH